MKLILTTIVISIASLVPLDLFSQYYVRGDHNSWGTTDQLTLKSGLGGGTSYYGTTFHAVLDNQFKIANSDYSHQWSSGYWITGYNQRWTIPANGANAIWKGSPSYYIHVTSQNPTSYVGSSLAVGIMTLSAYPAGISSVSQIGTFVSGIYQTSSTGDQTVNITLGSNKTSEENIYIRYTTNNWASDGWALATGSGTSYSAVIPGQVDGTTVIYYAISTTLTSTGSSDLDNYPDLMTINYNNNSGSNYSYKINTALPVTLSSFLSLPKTHSIQLQWSTASEINNSHFEVERSADGKAWGLLAKVEGYGTTNAPREYVYEDHAPMAGLNYYRLRQVDFDGTFSFSPVVVESMEMLEASALEVWPVPAGSTVNLRWNGKEASVVEVLDTQGRLLRRLRMGPGATLELPVGDLPRPMLFLRTANAQGEVTVRKVVLK